MIKKTIMSLLLIGACYVYGSDDPRDLACDNEHEAEFIKCLMNLAHFHRQDAYDFGKMYDDNQIHTASKMNEPMSKEEFVSSLNDLISDYIRDNETQQDVETKEAAEKAFVEVIFKLTQCKRDKRAETATSKEL